jgi:phosphoglycolate phosphatase-like HAD superfamily hydrolase
MASEVRPLRVAFDLDGVLADFAGAWGRVAEGLFPGWSNGVAPREPPPGDGSPAPGGDRTVRAGADGGDAGAGAGDGAPRLSRRRHDAVWKAIRCTPDFWLTLDETETGVVARLDERAAAGRWEVFFVTRRPATAGDTVQRQTQRWLVAHGFALPSVIVEPGPAGSRGRLAAALALDFLIDDTVGHCVDVVSESAATPLLVDPDPDAATRANAGRLGIGVCRGPGDSLDRLDRAAARRRPSPLRRVRRTLGL